MHTHTEQKSDELFVGNTDAGGIPPHLSSLKTARLGEVAYDIHGKKIPSDDIRPLFVGRSEADAYDGIMMARLSAIANGKTR